MKQTITILGRKADLIFVLAACALTALIVINTIASCSCGKPDKPKCEKCGKAVNSDCKCDGSKKAENNLPINSGIVGADNGAFDLMTNV
jgi:hypothetical protein